MVQSLGNGEPSDKATMDQHNRKRTNLPGVVSIAHDKTNDAGGKTMLKRERCPYAGCILKTRPDAGNNPMNGQSLGNLDFKVEDRFENVAGRSWMFADGNPTALIYALRTGMKGNVPIDNDVVYGKIDGLGYAFHVSELVTEQ